LSKYIYLNPYIFWFILAGKTPEIMELQKLDKPSKDEQIIASQSLHGLKTSLQNLNSQTAEIEIEETKEKIVIPVKALELMAKILEELSKGNPVSVVPMAMELTTQAAAEIVGCSRPHLVKLLDNGTIPHVKVGKHRRVLYEDVVNYRKSLKENQRKALIEMMEHDERIGLYDS
jgi:excisionase family DNA binding protein